MGFFLQPGVPMKLNVAPFALAFALTTTGFTAMATTPAQWQAKTSNVQITLEQALQNAVKAVPGTVIEIELDEGKGQGVRYEAEVLTPTGESMDVWIDGASGQARVHESNGKAKRKDQERAQAAKIDMPSAIRAATTHTPGKAVKAELDNHWGTVTYQVDVLQPDFTVMEVKVDASNGNVLRAKKD